MLRAVRMAITEILRDRRVANGMESGTGKALRSRSGDDDEAKDGGGSVIRPVGRSQRNRGPNGSRSLPSKLSRREGNQRLRHQ